MMLELSGYDARAAFSGPDGIDAALAFQPDVAFLDIGLPGMNGYEVARRFKTEPRLAHVRLVALTGWGTEDDRIRTREFGFNHHLTKPVNLATLRLILGSLTPHPR